MPYPGKSKDEIIELVMRRYKEGNLRAGDSDHKAKSHQQALAIALSEGRKYGSK